MSQQTINLQRSAFSVFEFCAAFRMSKAHFYNLLKAGVGPRLMKIGRRTLISAEAAEEWRKRMEGDFAKAA